MTTFETKVQEMVRNSGYTKEAAEYELRGCLAKAEAKADDYLALAKAASALLYRVDNITSDAFSKGGERKEREALRAALAGIGIFQ